MALLAASTRRIVLIEGLYFGPPLPRSTSLPETFRRTASLDPEIDTFRTSMYALTCAVVKTVVLTGRQKTATEAGKRPRSSVD
jgi:hypothetical protein